MTRLVLLLTAGLCRLSVHEGVVIIDQLLQLRTRPTFDMVRKKGVQALAGVGRLDGDYL